MDIVQKHKKANKFYAILNEINEFPTYDKQEEWTKLQMVLTYSLFLGKNESYETYIDNKLKNNSITYYEKFIFNDFTCYDELSRRRYI